MTPLGEQTWFRSGDRTLEGWVHRPDDGHAVGAVVIAGSFAHETVVAYRALRVLAVEAARRGFVAVRFSWSGTGDSEPAPTGVPLASVWHQDLAAATELAGSASGIEHVDAIGVRFGAAVVDTLGVPFRTRVLWEPLGGRAFLRMQSSLLTLHLPAEFPRATQGLELCGEMLEEDAAASIRALPDPRRANPADVSAGHRVILEDDLQTSADLFGGSPQDARVPRPSLRRVLDALEPAPAVALPRWAPARETTTVDPLSGRELRQTLLEVGPHRLPGILTEPLDGVVADKATMFVPFGNEPKGVDRICRATSMRLGGRGVVSLRADRRGIGDAANPDDLEEPPAYSDAAAADIADIARWLAERTGTPITGIGLCSGAWFVARAAMTAPFEHVIMVNNGKWATSRRYAVRQQRIFQSLRAAAVLDAEGRVNLAKTEEPGLAQRIKHAIRYRAPYQVRYRLYSAFGVDAMAETVLRAVPSQTKLTLLIGYTGDRRRWDEARGPDAIRRLIRRGRTIDAVFDPRADHSLMSAAGFEAYLDLLDREFGLRYAVTA